MDVIYENKTNLIEFNCSSILGETMHLHKEIEIVYAISGQSMAYADKNGYLLNPGDTFIAFPNQIHYYETIERGEYMVLIFPKAFRTKMSFWQTRPMSCASCSEKSIPFTVIDPNTEKCGLSAA